MRQPWTRSQERFIRRWQVLGEIPLPVSGEAFALDPFATQGGEGILNPADKASPKLPDGTVLKWRENVSWGDAIDLSDGNGLKLNRIGYAATTIARATAGPALLSLGSDESMRAWVNGKLVLERRGPRPLTFDEDLVEVQLKAGDNLLLVKVEQRTGPWIFGARVLESGSIPSRVQEIGPSYTVSPGDTLVVKTDLDGRHVTEGLVTVQAIAPSGRILAEKTAPRGETVRFDASVWPDGPYEIRCATEQLDGLRWATHLAWYKGDAVVAARELVAAGAKADPATPHGQTVKMLAEMVLDRLGKDGLAITGNPWWVIHSPLLEYAEIKLESAGEKAARARAYGFYRLAWRDEADGSPQFARAYLPGGYDPAKKWPLVVKLHGHHPTNPEYVRWWAAGDRHSLADADYGHGEGIIYVEPHGRGNTNYLGIGDADVLRAIQEAKEHFNVDADRVYLCGDSMGGWGTWNVGTRHPDLFAAIAPIYGGVDYHSYLGEEELAALSPLDRFLDDADSTTAMAENLRNLPLLILQGDADRAVNPDWSRYGVRMLQRWGYDVRYLELPGYGHEDLNRFPVIFSWFLQHRRNDAPREVRLRSADLKYASAYWAMVDVAARPDEFMVVDAEVVAPNTIRVDSQNVLALTLSPGKSLIDPAAPVKVVWNGQARAAAVSGGRIELRSPGLTTPALAKNSRIAGPIKAIFATPFALVVGTCSGDPAMNEICRQKAQELVDGWKHEQHHASRVFQDTEITAEDSARYSLILIGGADANRVTRKLADRLPLQLAKDQVTIGGQSFAAVNGRVQMIYPNPLNPERYVLVIAANSTDGMRFWPPGNLGRLPIDFTVEDGHVTAIGQRASPAAIPVAAGWFDRNWSIDTSLVTPGDPAVRAKTEVLCGPPDSAVLDTYAGRYQLDLGVVAVFQRVDNRLLFKTGDDPTAELIPAGADRFYLFDGPVVVTFQKDAAGKIVSVEGRMNYSQFSGNKIN